MKAGTFTEKQIVALLQDAQKGEKTVEELCRDLGCSTASFSLWKKRYGDASVAEAKRIRRLERENDRLLKIVGVLSRTAPVWGLAASSAWRSKACGRSWQKSVSGSRAPGSREIPDRKWRPGPPGMQAAFSPSLVAGVSGASRTAHGDQAATTAVHSP
ncbi:transposase [Deinococcus radiomollis]|uniref:transposase n=1 Tax=Deinococcus radiomollis TaxID=468916 RepID=UPI0038927B29